MAKRLTTEFVREKLAEEGYELLSEYENSQISLEIKCPKGHITNTMTWNNFQQGKR